MGTSGGRSLITWYVTGNAMSVSRFKVSFALFYFLQIKFPSAFSLPPSQIKLTQAFWLLDHEDFEEAISVLLDPLIADRDITPAQHRLLLALLYK